MNDSESVRSMLGESPDVAPASADRVFVNRGLRFDEVSTVGFDMDYTLAVYNQAAMNELGIAATVTRLIERGYPEELQRLTCSPDFAIRGLLVDTRFGNVLQMDRYRYVKRAYHGTRELDREDRRALYEQRRLVPGSDRYHWIDTLYGVSEVVVYCAAVDLLEEIGDGAIDYATLFADVRESIDEAHRTGEITAAITADLDRFLVKDDALGTTLHRLRSSGKRLFLLTNSPPEATDALMTYLLSGSLPQYSSWDRYFDLVLCSARKPLWFTGREPFVDVASPTKPVTQLQRGRVYTGGNIHDFENFAGVGGAEVLYVGDHIYGDVVRASLERGWRTMMIVQELGVEMVALEAHREKIDRIDELDELMGLCHDELRAQRAILAGTIEPDAAQLEFDLRKGSNESGDAGADPVRRQRERAIERLIARIGEMEDERDVLEAEVEFAFHPHWGSLFKAGSEMSSFGAQVEKYAWLYAEKVSSLGAYSPFHYFRSPRALMAHE